eukprot:4579890-Alexandrium_andersonii.AAC.1
MRNESWCPGRPPTPGKHERQPMTTIGFGKHARGIVQTDRTRVLQTVAFALCWFHARSNIIGSNGLHANVRNTKCSQ